MKILVYYKTILYSPLSVEEIHRALCQNMEPMYFDVDHVRRDPAGKLFGGIIYKDDTFKVRRLIEGTRANARYAVPYVDGAVKSVVNGSEIEMKFSVQGLTAVSMVFLLIMLALTVGEMINGYFFGAKYFQFPGFDFVFIFVMHVFAYHQLLSEQKVAQYYLADLFQAEK